MIDYSVVKHTRCELGNITASEYGTHIATVYCDDDIDNGRIIKIGAWKDFDRFEIDDVTQIDAEIVEFHAASGLWLVLVRDIKDPMTALIYSEPIIDEESPRVLTNEENFFNGEGDNARALLLSRLDRFYLSANGFNGTPAVGKKITTITNGKPVIV